MAGCPSRNPSSSTPVSGAAQFIWGSFYDTDIDVGSFFATDHAVMVRFMQQHERSYEGPLFTSVDAAGGPVYSVGTDTFVDVAAGGVRTIRPAISVRLGGNVSLFKIPHPVPATPDYSALTSAPAVSSAVWRHLIVVRRGNLLEVWLDGDHLCRDGSPPATCDFPISGPAPTGRLRLGKRPIDSATQTETQFYGNIDDLAVIDHALTQNELSGWFLTGAGITETVAGLRSGLTFDQSGEAGPRLRPISSLSGTARIVAIGAQHASGIDAPNLPIVAGSAPLELPFIGQEIWEVLQEFTSEGSHAGGAAFCWDFIFVPDDHQRGKARLDGSQGEGRTFIASSPGTVDVIQQNFSSVSDPANFVVIKRAEDEFVSYLHQKQNSVFPNIIVGANVAKGAQLAKVSNVGGGTPHLHFALLNRPETVSGMPFTQLVTRPSYFVDYCASNDFGQSWEVVRIGMPRLGQWVKRMQPDATCKDLVRTDDPADELEARFENDVMPANEIEFVLESGPGITWQKEIVLVEGAVAGTGRWTLMVKDSVKSSANGLYTYQLPGGRLEVRKAKTFGVMTEVKRIDISRVKGGSRVTYRWVKDS